MSPILPANPTHLSLLSTVSCFDQQQYCKQSQVLIFHHLLLTGGAIKYSSILVIDISSYPLLIPLSPILDLFVKIKIFRKSCKQFQPLQISLS